MKKALTFVLLTLSTLVVSVAIFQYLICPRFSFDEPAPFEGPKIYNPYASVKPHQWVKSNFHAHARAWNGITNGHGTARDVHNAYHELGYGIHCVSNYHLIDETDHRHDSYLPAYEHGYNVTKTHQLVLGGKKVTWCDYLLPQTLHNKQQILKELHNPDAVVILNHPAVRKGYTTSDLRHLTNYDCMEVLNPAGTSFSEWDAALSAGKKVFIVGNDDTHDVIGNVRVGEMCTFVNIPETKCGQVLEALKSGKSYGVIIGKTQQPDKIPFLKAMTVKGDSVYIEMSEDAAEVTLTGQHGRVLAEARNTRYIRYRLQNNDHYARASFRYSNGTGIFLNPVFFLPESGYKTAVSYIDATQTTFYRLTGTLILILWILLTRQILTGRGRFRRRSNRKQLSLS